MEKEKTDLVSLAELARELNVNKSKIRYYVNLGLIQPYKKMDATTIFSRQDVLKKLAEIKKKKEKGYSLTGKKFTKYK